MGEAERQAAKGGQGPNRQSGQGGIPDCGWEGEAEYPRTMSENSLQKFHETRFKNLTSKKTAQGKLEPREEKELTRLVSLLSASKGKGAK